MKKIFAKDITQTVKQMCMEANYCLPADVQRAILEARKAEKSPLGADILEKIAENFSIAQKKRMPICQDTGMAVFFVEIGCDVFVEGNLTEAINLGVRQGYAEGYLRKSVVADPLLRVNTNDNTPAIIHYDIVEGDAIDITFAPKGFGSENMSALKMFSPSAGEEGVKQFVLDTVEKAGPNPCPPMVVGVGIGGTMEKCALLAKKALARSIDIRNPMEYYKCMEAELLEKINRLGVGPQGFGGTTTALAVNIETFPTHIAGLPVAVNIGCHVTRHVHTKIV